MLHATTFELNMGSSLHDALKSHSRLLVRQAQRLHRRSRERPVEPASGMPAELSCRGTTDAALRGQVLRARFPATAACLAPRRRTGPTAGTARRPCAWE